MNETLKAIRDEWERITDGGRDMAEIANFALDYLPMLIAELDIKDKEIAELENEAFEKYWANNSHHSIKNEHIIRLEDANAGLKKQLQKGVEIVDGDIPVYLSSEGRCNVCDEWDGEHTEDCKLNEWLKEVSQEANDGNDD
jgi:hypothetical protein